MFASVYFDSHSTTCIDPRILPAIAEIQSKSYGNPSSTDHVYGDEASQAISTAKRAIADLLNAKPREIIFTSGATESLNLAIQGTVNHLAAQGKRPRVACTTVEHDAVLATCRALAKQQRIQLVELPVDDRARIDLDEIDRQCASGLDLLCVMAANNEVGTLYPVRDLAAIANRHGTAYLCDAAQAAGKIPLDFDGWGIAMLAISGHKMYGPKGIGALLVRNGHRLEPLLYGGGQQNGLRPGTLNVPGIVGLGEACRLRREEMHQDEPRIARQRDRLQALLQERIPGLRVNGDLDNRLAGNLHISIPGIPNSAAIARVRHQLAISTGSACSSGVEMPSHVLRAMHLSDAAIEGALRLGLGKFTTDEEIEIAADLLATEVAKIRELLAV